MKLSLISAILIFYLQSFGAVQDDFRRQVQTTPFIRPFLVVTNAPEARAYLGLVGGGTNIVIGGATGFQVFNTVSDMVVADPTLGTNALVIAGGEVYQFDSTSQATTNSITWASTFPGYESAGRWIKQNQGSQLVVDTSGFITNYTVITVVNKAQLQNIDTSKGIQLVKVQGKYNPGDGWGGDFLWNPASTYVADDALHVAPNAGAGTWDRIVPDPLEQFPATWVDPNLTNGVIQFALVLAASLPTNNVSSREVLLPPTFIQINGNVGLQLYNGVGLVGQSGTVLAASADTTNGYKLLNFNGVTNSAAKNISLVGLASATGYGIFVTNSQNILWGGIGFTTNFLPAPVWITNSSLVSPFDAAWNRNTLKAYGAQGNYFNNDTIPMQLAIANAGQGIGDRITVTPGSYAMNPWVLLSSGVVIEALNQGGQGVTNYTFTPYNPALPVLCFGTNSNPSGYPNRSITIRGIMFDYRGPSYVSGTAATYGQYGLSIRGGTESLYVDNCEVQGFSKRGVELVGGTVTGAGVENITFNNLNVQVSTESATNNTVGFYAEYMGATNSAGAGSDLTKITLISGKMNGANGEGYILQTRGVRIDFNGTYLDGFGTNMVWEQRYTNNPTGTNELYYYPVLYGRPGYLDNHSGNKAAVFADFPGGYPWSGLWGDWQTSSEIKWSDNNNYPIYASLPPGTNFLYFPVSYGRLKFNRPGTYLEEPENWIYNDSTPNLVFGSTNNFIFTHKNNGLLSIQAGTKPQLQLLETGTTNSAVVHVTGGALRVVPSSGLDSRIDNDGANRVFSIGTNAVADGIRITSLGVGINQTAPAYPLTIRGNQSVVNGTEVSLSVTETNLSGSRSAIVIQQQFNPTGVGTNTTTAEALSVEGGTASAATNAATAEGVRVAMTHRSANLLTNATVLHIGGSAITGGGTISNNIGLQIDNQTVGGTNWAIKTGTGYVQLGDTLSYAAEGGTAISPVGKDANGKLTTNGLGFVSSASATAVAGRDANNNVTTAGTTGLVPTFAGMNLNGTLSVNTGSLALDGAAENLLSTWNAGGTVFTGVRKIALTDTAHAAGSLVDNITSSAVTIHGVDPNGDIRQFKPITLTESSATLVRNFPITSGKSIGAYIIATVNASDGTDFQSRTTTIYLDAVNKGGTVTAGITATDNSNPALSAGTLTATYTAVANGNSVDLKCNAVSSLTQNVLSCRLKGTINDGQ